MKNYLMLILSGICLSLMIGFNGLLSNSINVFEVSLLVHGIGLVLLVFTMMINKEKITFRGIHPLYYLTGLAGVGLVSINSYTAVEIGITLSVALSILAQLVSSAVIDHYGMFSVPVEKFNKKRIFPLVLITIGLLVMILG